MWCLRGRRRVGSGDVIWAGVTLGGDDIGEGAMEVKIKKMVWVVCLREDCR
jgi:serine acetyltransferase